MLEAGGVARRFSRTGMGTSRSCARKWGSESPLGSWKRGVGVFSVGACGKNGALGGIKQHFGGGAVSEFRSAHGETSLKSSLLLSDGAKAG